MTDSIIKAYDISGLPSDRGIADWALRPLANNIIGDRLVIRDNDFETYTWDGSEWTIPNKTTDGSGDPVVGAGSFTTLAASGVFTSTVASGTAAISMLSTTQISNLNASYLTGLTFAAPGAIGGGTAAAGSFTTLNASGVAKFAAGTAANPSISFTGDPNSGLISSAADSVGIVTGGVEKWVVNSSGSLNPVLDTTYDIGSGAVNPRDVQASRKLISGNTGSATGVIEVKGATSGTVSVSTDATATKLTVDKPIQSTVVNGFVSSDASPGISGTLTTADLVGKTLTFKDGIITGYA